MMNDLFIGLISGTSMDGVDAVLVDYTGPTPKLLASLCHPYPELLRARLKALCDEKIEHNELNIAFATDRAVAECFADAVDLLLAQADVDKTAVTAIGSHGQTIRHYPDDQHAFTVQIGDPNTIAALTGIDVIADFRRKDIALGGQGAPMVPAFHQAVFQSDVVDRVIVNLGGIANLTFLPKDKHRAILGYDTGPANTLCDQWIQLNQDLAFDEHGQWAAGGHEIPALLAQMLQDDYFAQSPPKSTGREKFNLDWLANFTNNQAFKPQDIQKTLVALSARSLADQIQQCADSGEVYLCGGGAHNACLSTYVKSYLPTFKVSNTNVLGVHPDWVEAMAFSYLARAFMLKMPGNIPSVTGAQRPAVLGCLYLAE